MSSDDGYILRKRSDGKFALQHYFASAPMPKIDDQRAIIFYDAGTAINYYNSLDEYTEYGLSMVGITLPAPTQKEPTMTAISPAKYMRKPFLVDAVQVTEANMPAVADWCSGTIRNTGAGTKYIQVSVNRPLNDRQTRAQINDWVLKADMGFKVFTPKAFSKDFEAVDGVVQDIGSNS